MAKTKYNLKPLIITYFVLLAIVVVGYCVGLLDKIDEINLFIDLWQFTLIGAIIGFILFYIYEKVHKSLNNKGVEITEKKEANLRFLIALGFILLFFPFLFVLFHYIWLLIIIVIIFLALIKLIK